MTLNPNEDTEFNDALRKHGILPALPPKSRSPSPVLKTKEEEYEEMLDDELRELAEEADEETERYLERLRKQREAEAKKERQLGRFGRVYPIGRDDYTREVTEASMENEPGEDVQAEDEDLDDDDRKGNEDKPKKGLGTGVVCFLYKDGIPRSDLVKRHVEILAARHPRTKFRPLKVLISKNVDGDKTSTDHEKRKDLCLASEVGADPTPITRSQCRC